MRIFYTLLAASVLFSCSNEETNEHKTNNTSAKSEVNQGEMSKLVEPRAGTRGVAMENVGVC